MPSLEYIDEPVYIHGFPWRNSSKNLIHEYENLKNRVSKTKTTAYIPYRRIGYSCSNYFFQYSRLSTPSQGKPSCVQNWYKNHDKIMCYHSKRNQYKNKSDLYGTISFMFHAPAQFPPLTACMIYKYFSPTFILDPYAGWGDRCLAAMSMDIDYMGIDSNTELKVHYELMEKMYPHKSQVTLFKTNAKM